MSREERRQYQRMMRGQDRAPSLPPAARARAERLSARRAARPPPSFAFGPRFWAVAIVIAAFIGLIGFSLQWPNMPFALYVGLVVAVAALLAQAGLRFLQRRTARR